MRPLKPLPDYDYLVKTFEYDESTGVLVRRRTGKPVLTENSKGYVVVKICRDGKEQMFQATRIIWKLLYGTEPEGKIDHINGIVNDNRSQNLRLIDASRNQVNSRRHLGYSKENDPRRHKKPLRVLLHKDGKRVFSKHVACPLIARLEYIDAVKEYHELDLPLMPDVPIIGR